MSGYRQSTDNKEQRLKQPGEQRLKPPGSAKAAPATKQVASHRSSHFLTDLLRDHWGKAVIGFLLVPPYFASHLQMNQEHPEFSAFSMGGVAQRVVRTLSHLDAVYTAARYRTDASFNRLSESFSLSRGPALSYNAVVCYDTELLIRAKDEELPHAQAFLRAANAAVEQLLEQLGMQDAPFYKQHSSWDPDKPLPTAAIDVDYDKTWYPGAPVEFKKLRPVNQWIAESGGGCPDSKTPVIRKLPFKIY